MFPSSVTMVQRWPDICWTTRNLRHFLQYTPGGLHLSNATHLHASSRIKRLRTFFVISFIWVYQPITAGWWSWKTSKILPFRNKLRLLTNGAHILSVCLQGSANSSFFCASASLARATVFQPCCTWPLTIHITTHFSLALTQWLHSSGPLCKSEYMHFFHGKLHL